MRNFIAYHNAKTMGYSCTAILTPQVRTKNSVSGLTGVKVWLIAGEGERPKSYYLASTFVADQCRPAHFPDPKLPNLIAGAGTNFGLSISISGSSLLELLKSDSANFRRGFYETFDHTVISQLQRLA